MQTRIVAMMMICFVALSGATAVSSGVSYTSFDSMNENNVTAEVSVNPVPTVSNSKERRKYRLAYVSWINRVFSRRFTYGLNWARDHGGFTKVSGESLRKWLGLDDIVNAIDASVKSSKPVPRHIARDSISADYWDLIEKIDLDLHRDSDDHISDALWYLRAACNALHSAKQSGQLNHYDYEQMNGTIANLEENVRTLFARDSKADDVEWATNEYIAMFGIDAFEAATAPKDSKQLLKDMPRLPVFSRLEILEMARKQMIDNGEDLDKVNNWNDVVLPVNRFNFFKQLDIISDWACGEYGYGNGDVDSEINSWKMPSFEGNGIDDRERRGSLVVTISKRGLEVANALHQMKVAQEVLDGARDSKKYTRYVQNDSHFNIDVIEGNTKDEFIQSLFQHIACTSGYHEITIEEAVESIMTGEASSFPECLSKHIPPLPSARDSRLYSSDLKSEQVNGQWKHTFTVDDVKVIMASPNRGHFHCSVERKDPVLEITGCHWYGDDDRLPHEVVFDVETAWNPDEYGDYEDDAQDIVTVTLEHGIHNAQAYLDDDTLEPENQQAIEAHDGYAIMIDIAKAVRSACYIIYSEQRESIPVARDSAEWSMITYLIRDGEFESYLRTIRSKTTSELSHKELIINESGDSEVYPDNDDEECNLWWVNVGSIEQLWSVYSKKDMDVETKDLFETYEIWARDSAEMAALVPSRYDENVSARELHPNVSLLNPDGFKWSDEQLHILNDFAWWFQEYQDGAKISRPRMVIESVAGSGKTTLVKELLSIINRFDSATKTIASAFNVHIAKILKDEIKDQQKNGFRGLETLGNSNSVSAGGYDIIRSHLKAQGITNVGMESNVEGKYLVLSKIILAEYFAMISKPDGVKNANVGEVIRIMKDVCEFSQAAKPNYRNQYMKLARDLKKFVEALMGQGFVPTRSKSEDLKKIRSIYGQIALVQGLNDTILLKLPKNAIFTLARDVLLRSMDTWNSQKEVFPFAWTKNYSFSDVIVARTEGFAESGNFEKARFDSNNLYPLWKTLTRDVWDNDKLKTNMLFDHLSKAGLIWPPRSKESGKPTVSTPSGKPACEVWVKGNQMSVSFRDGLAASSKIDGSRACDFLKYNGIKSQWPRNNLNAGKYNESIVKKLETKFKSAKGGFKLHGDSSADIVIEESRSKVTVSFSDHTWLPIALNLEPSADVKKDMAFIDEIQDLSVAKGSLIRKLIRNDGDSGLVLVGDRRQSIMGWSGASPTAMIDNAAASNCVSYPMTICWRGSHEVAHSANRVMSSVLEEVQGLWPQTEFPDYLSHKSPSIETWPVGKPMENVGTDKLVPMVKELQENPDVEIAVLSRVNQPLGAVILDLVTNGISITTPSGKDGIVNSIKPILTNKYVEPKSPSQGIGIDMDNATFKDLRSVRNRLEQVTAWAYNQSVTRNKGDADAAAKDEKFVTIEGNAELAIALIELWFREGVPSSTKHKDFVDWFNNVLLSSSGNPVHVSSVHKFKGGECDVCFILRSAKGKPDKETGECMPREIFMNKSMNDAPENAIAEACIMYVALTRSKSQNVQLWWEKSGEEEVVIDPTRCISCNALTDPDDHAVCIECNGLLCNEYRPLRGSQGGLLHNGGKFDTTLSCGEFLPRSADEFFDFSSTERSERNKHERYCDSCWENIPRDSADFVKYEIRNLDTNETMIIKLSKDIYNAERNTKLVVTNLETGEQDINPIMYNTDVPEYYEKGSEEYNEWVSALVWKADPVGNTKWEKEHGCRDSAWDDEKLSYAIGLLSWDDVLKYREWVDSQEGYWNDDGTVSFANANAKLDYDMRQLRQTKLDLDMGYCRETELLLCNLERHGFTLVGHRPYGDDLIKFNRTRDDEGNMPSNHYDIQNIIYDCWNHEETTLIVNHPSRGDREIGIRLVYGNEFGVLAADYSAPKDWLADPEWYVALRSAANTDIDSIEEYEAITGSSMEYRWNDNLGRMSGKITFDDMIEDGNYKYKLCPKCLESGHENNQSYCHRYGASLSNGDTGSCIGYPSEKIARDSNDIRHELEQAGFLPANGATRVCCNCEKQAVFDVDTAIGTRSFCSEKCYAEYNGLEVMDDPNFYGMMLITRKPIETVYEVHLWTREIEGKKLGEFDEFFKFKDEDSARKLYNQITDYTYKILMQYDGDEGDLLLEYENHDPHENMGHRDSTNAYIDECPECAENTCLNNVSTNPKYHDIECYSCGYYSVQKTILIATPPYRQTKQIEGYMSEEEIEEMRADMEIRDSADFCNTCDAHIDLQGRDMLPRGMCIDCFIAQCREEMGIPNPIVTDNWPENDPDEEPRDSSVATEYAVLVWDEKPEDYPYLGCIDREFNVETLVEAMKIYEDLTDVFAKELHHYYQYKTHEFESSSNCLMAWDVECGCSSDAILPRDSSEFVTITLEEMDNFLVDAQGFRRLNPDEVGHYCGEWVYEYYLEPTNSRIRVYSSIPVAIHNSMNYNSATRGKGKDAIRCILLTGSTSVGVDEKCIGKATSTKRITLWRLNLLKKYEQWIWDALV